MTKIVHSITSFIRLIDVEAEGRTRPGKANFRRSPGSDYDCNSMGVKGEIAAATYLGVPLEYTNILGREADPGWDFRYCGKKIDAKYISYMGSPRDMMVTPEQVSGLSRADILVLVGATADDSEVEMIGCISVKKFLQIKRRKTYRFDQQWFVSERDMSSILEMERWAQNRGSDPLRRDQ